MRTDAEIRERHIGLAIAYLRAALAKAQGKE